MTLLSKRCVPLPVLATALLSAGILHPVSAQTASKQTNQELRARAQKRVAALFTTANDKVQELHLTADQKTKLRAIAQKNAPVARAIWNNDSLTQQQKMAKLGALKNEARAVLTPAQREKLGATQGDAMGKVFETAAWVSNELNLSSDQQDKIRGIVMTSFMQGRSMTGGQQGQFGAIRNLVMDTNGQIEKVLTPQQKTKWAVIRSVAREEVVKKTRQWRAMERA